MNKSANTLILATAGTTMMTLFSYLVSLTAEKNFNEPGISHAGNYTGKVLKPAPPVYDPVGVAQAMVKVAANPRLNNYIGSVSVLLKLSHAIFPELTTKITGSVMRRYFKAADPIVLSDGNVFTTVDYGMSTYGGFGLPGEPKAHRKYIAGL